MDPMKPGRCIHGLAADTCATCLAARNPPKPKPRSSRPRAPRPPRQSPRERKERIAESLLGRLSASFQRDPAAGEALLAGTGLTPEFVQTLLDLEWFTDLRRETLRWSRPTAAEAAEWRDLLSPWPDMGASWRDRLDSAFRRRRISRDTPTRPLSKESPDSALAAMKFLDSLLEAMKARKEQPPTEATEPRSGSSEPSEKKLATTEKLRKFLKEAADLGRFADLLNAACESWDRYLQARGLPLTPPPPDLMRKLRALVRGRLTLDEYRTWLGEQDLRPLREARGADLDWEILPPGFWRNADLPDWPHPGTAEQARERLERLDFLANLGPEAFYRGRTMESRNYVVAEFPGVALAECAWEGNALYYVLTETHDWREVFCLTKREALEAGARRVFHRADGLWREKVRDLVGR